MKHNLCEACETAAYCSLKGCIPVQNPQPVHVMSVGKIILAAFKAGESLTNAEISRRTGFSVRIVSSWVAQHRAKGFLDKVSGANIPVVHRLTGHIHARVDRAELSSIRDALLDSDNIVKEAIRTQPVSIWHLAKGSV